MTEFILYIATSIDGFIARTDGSIDWLPLPEVDGEDYGYAKFYNSIDAVVMGSRTYEQVLGFGDWAYPGKLTYVFTNRHLSTTRTDILFIRGSIEKVILDVKQRGFKRVWLVGGGNVISSFMNRGLVDEYIITIIPIILGSGISLFQSVSELKLDFVDSKSYLSGAVELRYKAIKNET
ncbi:dihydrofolate reductase family protein [Calothrix sp. UHCC 0171]|uniref:dihydrofolate reductase family protein n=1 Tax=Calothrix sp. UHCC 0171 TaxID=3110245 RepID=UPI002B20166D|nr:dihydrofolate reductase family protein [Calothrix sp. UHCC 0171]MEA5571118.1 dihydrofolate reductase family protein [Calothrix sp. UHCC 0171]